MPSRFDSRLRGSPFSYRRARALLALVLLVMLPNAAFAQTFPDKPPSTDYFVDLAALIEPAEREQINKIAGDLLKEQRIPIYVVTVRSLLQFEAAGLGVDAYARQLFDEWGIGSEDRNNGMLLFVSLGDRKARIELGSAWNSQNNREAETIMSTLIVPQFKASDYSAGILAGVQGMDSMARGLGLPAPKQPWWVIPVMILTAIGLIALVVSLFRSGRKGMGWAVIVGVGVLLFFMLRSAGNSGSGGGFGGGSGGGGGASGSW